MKLGILASHPVQYHAPLYRALAARCDLTVYYAHRPSAEQQGAGFGRPFEWDGDLLGGYRHFFLANRARRPNVSRFGGCHTPEIGGLIRDRAFDAFMVSGWGLRAYWQAVRACRRLNVPVLVRGDSQLHAPRPLAARAAKAVFYPFLQRMFDGFLAVGQRNREYLLRYGVSQTRIFDAPHCVDVTGFARAAERADVAVTRRTFGADEAVRVILFVGKFIAEKNLPTLIEAARGWKDRQPRTEVWLAGSGPLETELRASAQDLPVRFLGFRNQSELPALYAAADVLVLPSVSETWGLVVNEAQACGTPVVVSDAAGCAPDLACQPCGRTYRASDPAALYAAVEGVLAKGKTSEVREALRRLSLRFSPGAAADGILAAARSLAHD